jgi:hypothetical protein
MNTVDFILKNSFGICKFSNDNLKDLMFINSIFLNLARKFCPNLTNLQNLHEFITEKDFIELHFSVNKVLHDEQLLYPIFQKEENLIKKLFGNDVDIQSYPHVRISRPNIVADNVGLHRDIEYGASINEFSLWIPLHDVVKGSGMSIYPDSISAGYDGFPFEKRVTEIVSGSKKNYSGLPYTINNVILSESQRAKLIEPFISFGQILVIPLLSVHGAELNTTKTTRWSIDIRVCNSYALDPKSTLEKRRNEIVNSSLRDSTYPYYRPLFRGLASQISSRFLDPQIIECDR